MKLSVISPDAWSFRRIAQRIAARFGGTVTDADHTEPCDVAVVVWWRDHARVIADVGLGTSVVLCVYDHVSWCTAPIDIHEFAQAVIRSHVIVAANERIARQIAKAGLPLRPIFIAEDGVDTAMFTPGPLPEEFTIGWCGNSAAAGGSIKGVSAIMDAAIRAGVELSLCDVADGSGKQHHEMPEWYRSISCYVCASSDEGTPNPVLEALACGRPVISTRVGIVPRVIVPGANGWIVSRDAASIAHAIELVRGGDLAAMGEAAALSVKTWDWSTKIAAWDQVMAAAQRVVGKPAHPPAPPRLRRPGTKPRAMLVADVQGWAFDINERDMAKYCGHRWDFDHWYISQRGAPPSTHAAHAVFLPYHRWGTDACWSGVPLLGSLRSADFDPDRPGHLCAMDESFVQRCAGFHVVTREAEDRLRQYRNVVYLTNPVDCSRFDRSTEVDGLVVCFAGNPAHSTSQQDDVKGLRSIIIPACATLRIDLVTAEFAKRLPPSEMPSFYRRGSVYVCASAYEGASNAVMEAMASGLAVIATDVGNHREMRDSQIEHFGASGIMLVERSLDAVMDALRALTPRSVRDMGQINRQEILDRWSWAMWADRYLEFLGMAL